MAETVLLAKAERIIAVSLVDVPEPVKELHLLDSFAAEVDILQQLYLLASRDTEVVPLFPEVILLDRYEQYVGTEVTGIYLLAKHEAYIEPEGIPEEPPVEEPPAKVNWWLWGGLGLIAIVVAVAIARRGG